MTETKQEERSGSVNSLDVGGEGGEGEKGFRTSLKDYGQEKNT